MAETVDITISVTPEAAAMLARPGARELVAEVVNRMLVPASPERLLRVMDELGDAARARGLTQDILDEELATHKAERRARRGDPAA
jgi:hypothetical protein